MALGRAEGRELVCKRLRSGLRGHSVARAAMAREIAALVRVGGRYAPELVDRGEDAAGSFWLQTRALGKPVAAEVEAAGPLGAARIEELLRAAFAALASIHACGVIHGDINPDHLFSPGVCFIDFGLARVPHLDPALFGDERGTLSFVAPEVARGAPPDPPNDVYALAATIAFAALGREPCRAVTTAARLSEIAEHGCDLVALAGASLTAPALGALNWALAFDKNQRVTTAAAVVQML